MLRLSSCPGNGDGPVGLQRAMDGSVDVCRVAQGQSRLVSAKHLVYFGLLFGSGGRCEVSAGKTVPFILHKSCMVEGCDPGWFGG